MPPISRICRGIISQNLNSRCATYASQREALYLRDVDKAQKIRMRLGGSTVMSEASPNKPRACTGKRMSGSAVLTMPPSGVSMTGLLRHIDSRDRQKGVRY